MHGAPSANVAPELLGLSVNGTATAIDPVNTPVAAVEGVPVTLALTGRDTDFDWFNWTVAGLPTGMTIEVQEGSAGSSSLVLRWTPGHFAAQS